MLFSQPRICLIRPTIRIESDRKNSALRQKIAMFGGVITAAAMWALLASNAIAQPPGTAPPAQVFEPAENELPINAFLFLNESKNQVVMPGLTWEELQRLQDLDAGRNETGGRYSFESVSITGSTSEGRAELEVEIRLTIPPTGNQHVNVPLRMGNFHEISPPKISGVTSAMIDVAPDGSGYQLKAKTTGNGYVTVAMKVATKVHASPMEHLDLRLPYAATRIELTTSLGGAQGEVIGNADETIESIPLSQDKTKLVVRSSGGNFLLQWGKPQAEPQASETIEVESRVSVRWNSPQDQPVADVRMTARSVKGSIRGFKIKLPLGAVVLGTPRLGAGGQVVELRPIPDGSFGEAQKGRDSNSSYDEPGNDQSTTFQSATPEHQIRQVIIPEEEYQNRIDLNFELQLPGALATSDTPLMMKVPHVVGALRHHGELIFSVGREYRLRWKTQPWVRSGQMEPPDDSTSERSYRFRFDRGIFSLPVWLSTGARRLQLTSNTNLSVSDALATIEMLVNVNGSSTNSRLRIDPASWEITSVERADTNAPLEWFESESLHVIELGSVSSDENQTIRIAATLPIGQDLGEVSFPIPRIVVDRNDLVLRQSTIDLIRKGRTMMVVDLSASDGLARIVTPMSVAEPMGTAEPSGDSRISRFRISQSELAPFIAGTLVDQPPQVSLSASANVEIDGATLVTESLWDLDSSFDLEGRIPIQIPSIKQVDRQVDGLASSVDDWFTPGVQRFGELLEGTISGGTANDPEKNHLSRWEVTIDDAPATLRHLSGDRYELISDRLAAGTMSIRWRRTLAFPEIQLEFPQHVVLPRPDLTDVTLRGQIDVTLVGTSDSSWTAVEYPASATTPLANGVRSTNRLTLDTIPRDPIRLRLQPNQTRGDDRSVLRTVLRTAYGEATRHEQLLMTFQGGEELRIQLPGVSRGEVAINTITAEARIDGDLATVKATEDTLVVALPGDDTKHQIDLRLWATLATKGSINRVEPLMKLPVGVGRIYWQVIAPRDGHVMWASSSVGRAMSWRFDQWRLSREPSFNDQVLVSIAGGTNHTMPAGNPYLYVGSDLSKFEVIVFSRTILWAIVAIIVLGLSGMLLYAPITRHPATAIFVGVAFAYLLIRAPDAAVLGGQFGLISLVLVIVMLTVRSLLSGSGQDRLFDVSASPPSPADVKSTRTSSPTSVPAEAVTETQTFTPSSRFPTNAGAKS